MKARQESRPRAAMRMAVVTARCHRGMCSDTVGPDGDTAPIPQPAAPPALLSPPSTHLCRAPGTEGAHGQALLAGVHPSSGADVTPWNSKQKAVTTCGATTQPHQQAEPPSSQVSTLTLFAAPKHSCCPPASFMAASPSPAPVGLHPACCCWHFPPASLMPAP